ncbi:uncharacterized protein [Asterias amurensis]|uniref:uncharacterized protein n=1 Tax=Asterias amurensis TaxID=7602 RepID=UPI003AB62137
MTTQSVQVKLELGHRANIRDKRTPQGFTHDWLVFVRGPEGSNIQHFVDKVVFQLHESFPKPRRVVKEPPYEVSECGYAGFLMTIEVHFRSKEEPKKVILNYDLFLNTEQQPPVNHIRCEKLTFHNPTEDFRRKLLKAGGVGVLPTDPGVPTSPTAPSLPITEGGFGGKPLPPSFTDPSLFAKGKPQAAASSLQTTTKKYKTQGSKDGNKSSTKPVKEHKEGKTASKEPKTSSKEPKTSSKEPKMGSKEPKSSFKEPKLGSKEPKPSSKEPKTGSKEPKSSSIKEPKSSSKDTKTTSKEAKLSSKEPKPSSKELKTSPKTTSKDPTKTKTSGKRPASTSPAPSASSQDSAKKRKRSTTKEKDSSDRVPPEKSSSGKPSPAEKGSSGDKPKSKEKSSKPKLTKSSSVSRSDAGLFKPEITIARKPPKLLPVDVLKDLPPFEDELSTGEGGDPHSPSSSISFSSLPRGGGGVLNTLMAELADENDDDYDEPDIDLRYHKSPSPAPLQQPPSNHSVSSNEQDYVKFTPTPPPPPPPVPVEKPKNSQKSSGSKKSNSSNTSKKGSYASKAERKSKSSDSKKKSGDVKQKNQNSKPKSSEGKQKSSESKSKAADAKLSKQSDGRQKTIDSKPKITKTKQGDSKFPKSYLSDLISLHQKLSSLQNRDQLQRVVDLIEETGLFQVTDATFDFDLCSLDQTTLTKLQDCVMLAT